MNSRIQDIFIKFQEFEAKNNLFEKKIKDFTFWSNVRFYVYKEILENLEINSALVGSKQKKKKRLYKNIFTSIVKSPLFVKRKKYLILNTLHRELQDGKYKCIYTDYLNDIFENETQNIEFKSASNYKIPTYSENVKYTEFFELLSDIYYKILYKIHKLTTEEKEVITNVSELIFNEFGINKIYLIKLITNSYYSYKSRKPLYNYILKKTKAEYMVLVSGYTKTNHLFIYLAQKQGIKVIELQHGVISQFHLGYNMAYKNKVYGIPDKLVLFGEYWKNKVSLPTSTEIIISGFYRLNNALKEYSLGSNNNNKQTILIISQWTITKDILNFSIKLSEQLDAKKYNVLLRFHPAEYNKWNENFPQLKNSKVQVNDNKLSLYQNFSEADYVVGCYSTALYEAIAFKKRLFILSINGLEEHVADLYNEQYAIKINSANELVIALNKKSEYMNVDYKQMWYPKITIDKKSLS